MLRQDLVAIAEPLRELLWNRVPYACLSATLALDDTFDFFLRTTGAEPAFQEILPTPFDFVHQAALYLPPEGLVPDPSQARRNGTEDQYHAAIARELTQIIVAAEGRTLALFHSRREMEGVIEFMNLPPELPILVQSRSGASTAGEKFVKNVHASLFALRSFWTGFDAPGDTLSCVALVRVPFEVPTDPPQIARMAYLQTLGLDAFHEHTLPQAKMLMRQGAGRLIRRDSDKGIIALLDPRLQTKRYGEEILANLPPGMRTYRDVRDAIGWIGLLPSDAVA
jgi:ATP-dependent DNA helicase DinG